jgi:hypothetical protein
MFTLCVCVRARTSNKEQVVIYLYTIIIQQTTESIILRHRASVLNGNVPALYVGSTVFERWPRLQIFSTKYNKVFRHSVSALMTEFEEQARLTNHLKQPSGNYMSHLFQQSVILQFVFMFRMILRINSDYFLKQR